MKEEELKLKEMEQKLAGTCRCKKLVLGMSYCVSLCWNVRTFVTNFSVP